MTNHHMPLHIIPAAEMHQALIDLFPTIGAQSEFWNVSGDDAVQVFVLDVSDARLPSGLPIVGQGVYEEDSRYEGYVHAAFASWLWSQGWEWTAGHAGTVVLSPRDKTRSLRPSASPLMQSGGDLSVAPPWVQR